MISQSKMDKQKELLAAALKLFVEFGFHGTATSKIAKEAGVANGTLFHYYKTKDDLIMSLYIAIKMQMSDEVEQLIDRNADFKTQFKAQFAGAISWSIAHPDGFNYIQQFYNSPYSAMLKSEEIQQKMAETCFQIQHAVDTKILKSLPVDYIFTIVSSHTFGLNQYLKNNSFSENEQKQIISDSFEMIWEMLT